MTTTPDSEANGCVFQWKIENISHCWWLKTAEGIDSPKFIADALGGTIWSLSLYPLGYTDDKKVGILLNREEDCSGPNVVEIFFEIVLLGEGGQPLKTKSSPKTAFREGDNRGFPAYHGRETIFFTEKEIFLPEDTLTVHCTIWNQERTNAKLEHLYARSIFRANRRYFVWKFYKIEAFETYQRQNFKDNLIDFYIVLAGFPEMVVCITSLVDNIKYISYKTSLVIADGEKLNFGNGKYFPIDLGQSELSTVLSLPKSLIDNRSRFMPNDVLTLDFEFVFSVVEHFNYRENSYFEYEPYVATDVRNVKYRAASSLTKDFKSLYNDGIFSDLEIRTKTKTFPAHMNILSARSAVFSRMFSHDMEEANSGHLVITDFDDDTIHQMLLYIYTATLEDLQFESASKLYKIADKYDIMSLKSSCISYLILHLSPTNACDVLCLADQYHDNRFKNAVHDYIVGLDKPFFCSQEWTHFVDSNKDLALKILNEKVCQE